MKYISKIKNILFFLLAIVITSQGQNIVINEFMSNNETGILDEDGAYNDWIELYNNSNNAVDLSTYSLSDNMDDLSKWNFPEVTLNPFSFLLVFASSKDKYGNELHTNFKISKDGENIILSKNGIIIDQMTFFQRPIKLKFRIKKCVRYWYKIFMINSKTTMLNPL